MRYSLTEWEIFLVFFSFLARNGLKFLVSREKSKCEKNGNYIYNLPLPEWLGYIHMSEIFLGYLGSSWWLASLAIIGPIFLAFWFLARNEKFYAISREKREKNEKKFPLYCLGFEN